MNCLVREMQLAEVDLMIRYFLNAAPDYLNGMGVDPEKLPSEDDWRNLLQEDFARPIEQRQFFYLVWEADGVAFGHTNLNQIKFGQSAYMHLHIWNSRDRRIGQGTQLLRPSIRRYFQRLQLQELFCEPYARNPAPNRTLPKLGFQLIKSYETTPGWIAFHQPVNLWRLTWDAVECWETPRNGECPTDVLE